MPILCRDCQAHPDNAGGGRCAECGSPRLIPHDELFDLSIAHLDCDAFYASIEKHERPDLRNKPLIIGGGKRGVVATACYVARTYGIHSAMPLYKAKRACPDAVVLPPNMKKYATVSREIMETMRAVTPLVQPLSLDEAFLDLSGTGRLHKHPPAHSLAALVQDIEQGMGIPISIGLSYNKFLAKLASDMHKPRGFTVIGRKEAVDFLAPLPVSRIWGVGKSLETRLRKDGITQIGQLQVLDEAHLIKRYGAMGQRLARFSRGIDDRPVNPQSERKSVSSETTFDKDIAELGELSAILWRQCERVSSQLKAKDIAAKTITLKLKTSGFRLLTRQTQLTHPTQLADVIYRAALPLLERECGRHHYRLLGVGVSGLSSPDGSDDFDLLDPDLRRRARAERTLDDLRDKFGRDSVGKGRGWKPR